MVLYASSFEAWLTDGHGFARAVVKIAVCLYGKKHTLSFQVQGNSDAAHEKEMRYKDGMNKSNEFIAGAELYMLRKQNNLAAFMLHQAAEQALHAMFYKATGMYLHSHNIEKLMRYCTMVCYELPQVFFEAGKKISDY